MARKVEEFPEVPSQTKYPWNEWLDGGIWELVQGEDFSGRPHAFRSNARSQAKRRGGRIKGRVVTTPDAADKVYLQFLPGEGSDS